MITSNPRWVVLLFALPVLLSGCATSALWQEGQFANFHEPASPSHLELYPSATNQKILVGYDESNERNDVIRHRCYWVNLNCKPFKNPHKPDFVANAEQSKHSQIPIVTQSGEQPSTDSFYAVSTNGQDFTLFMGGRKVGRFELPVYKDASGRVKQILLTPVALVADATIVGGVLGLIWLESGAPGAGENCP